MIYQVQIVVTVDSPVPPDQFKINEETFGLLIDQGLFKSFLPVHARTKVEVEVWECSARPVGA